MDIRVLFQMAGASSLLIQKRRIGQELRCQMSFAFIFMGF